MTLADFLTILKECPLIASVQASPGSPLDDTETLLKLAQASVSQGVRILRLEGVENIKRIRGETGCPTIGLIKRKYPESELYITPTLREVEELLETGCEVIAIDARLRTWTGVDAVERSRAWDSQFKAMVDRCHEAGKLVLADCGSGSDDLEVAVDAGCDIGSTTFAHGQQGFETLTHPSIGNLWWHTKNQRVPVLAEGLFQTEAQIRWAMQTGAAGVVVGGSLNDPIKTTNRFVKAASIPTENVGAVDIGGTWLRFGLFSADWTLLKKARIKLPSLHSQRMNWISKMAHDFGVSKIGLSTGGVVDPRHGFVWSSKNTIPDNEDSVFRVDGLELRALNDGLASAWAHAAHHSTRGNVESARTKTVTLALGTGLGCGITMGFGLLDSCNYPRLNDLEFEDGKTFEDVLGGANLGKTPTQEQMDTAVRALCRAVDILDKLIQPEAIYLCGGVALSPWMRRRVKGLLKIKVTAEFGSERYRWSPRHFISSPFGADAGLYGAAALALFPPIGVFQE